MSNTAVVEQMDGRWWCRITNEYNETQSAYSYMRRDDAIRKASKLMLDQEVQSIVVMNEYDQPLFSVETKEK